MIMICFGYHEHPSDRLNTVASSGWRRRILLRRSNGGRRHWRSSPGGLDCLSCSGQSFVIRGTIEFETPIAVHIRAVAIRRSATSAYAASRDNLNIKRITFAHTKSQQQMIDSDDHADPNRGPMNASYSCARAFVPPLP
jgi:hypothetical protein